MLLHMLSSTCSGLHLAHVVMCTWSCIVPGTGTHLRVACACTPVPQGLVNCCVPTWCKPWLKPLAAGVFCMPCSSTGVKYSLVLPQSLQQHLKQHLLRTQKLAQHAQACGGGDPASSACCQFPPGGVCLPQAGLLCTQAHHTGVCLLAVSLYPTQSIHPSSCSSCLHISAQPVLQFVVFSRAECCAAVSLAS